MGGSSASTSHSTKPSSSVLDNFDQDNKYKPVTNFEPQERVNPFDKGATKTSALPQTTVLVGGGLTASSTSSSSISSSSISSRINRNGNNIRSPPPPTAPPPAPPSSAVAANPIMSSSYKSTTSYSISEMTKESKPSYGSSSSIESTTKMETTITTTATAGGTGGGDTDTAEAADAVDVAGPTTNPNPNTKTHIEWKPNMGLRSASVYSAPAAVNTTSAVLPGDTSGYVSNSSPASNGYNSQQPEVPSYTRPSYSRSESNASKQSDLDIIFGDKSAHAGNGKHARSSGSLSDAELIFGGPSSYKTDRFGSSKSMSVTSDRHNNSTATMPPYKIYEGIQNAAFSDYSDAPSKHSNSNTSINSYTSVAPNRWSQPHEEEDEELDLK